ncbi:hypothetical protein O5699_03965 [Escherichia coli]|nr:hypothetical protein [Escherichia coli]
MHVCENSRDSGRLLMVDEAELLPYRALEVLRRLHDKAGIGIVPGGYATPPSDLTSRDVAGEFAKLYSQCSAGA